MSERTLFLELVAPFAAFRWLQAGVFRATSPVIPPSAAWGLVLNLAGIETRGTLDEVVTVVRTDAPTLEISVGLVGAPATRSTLYQQLHGYPVGAAGKELQARSHGTKYWIAPARREILVGFHCVVGARGAASVLDRVGQGLAGGLGEPRYGLPFAGDNQLLFDRIDLVPDPQASWFVPVQPSEVARDSTQLTTVIDRRDRTRTRAPLFAPMATVGSCPSEAWTAIGPSAAA